MKKFILLIFAAYIHVASAQDNPTWIWAKKLPENVYNLELATNDDKGNLYAFASFSLTLDLGNGIILETSTTGSETSFIAIIDTNGITQWARKTTGINISGLSRDKDGNMYICGSFRDSADLGNGVTISEPEHKYSIVTAKFDKDGNAIWAKTPKYYFSSEYDRISVLSISTDKAGNSVIGGTFRGVYSFGDRGELVHLDSDQMFVARYNTNGESTWAWYSMGNGSAMVTSIAMDHNGNSRIGGHGSGNNYYRGYGVGGKNYDVFTIKVDSAYDATYLTTWGRNAGGNESDVLYDIAVDKENSVFICGQHGRNAAFGSVVFNLSESHSYSLYLAKYDSLGQFLWARSTTGANWSVAKSIALDEKGNAYICGNYSGIAQFVNNVELRCHDSPSSGPTTDMFIAKYEANGNFIWAQRAGWSGREGAETMVKDNENNLYIRGFYDSLITLGSTTLPRSGYNNTFIAKFSTQNVVGIFNNEESNSQTKIDIHPNPAYSTSHISFKTTAPSHTRLTLTDVLGRQTLLKEETLDAGEHSAEINTANFPAGIYVLTLEAAGQVFSQKVVIER